VASKTRDLAKCDAELRKLTERLRDGYDPDDLANLREDIDAWLDHRLRLTGDLHSVTWSPDSRG